MAIVIVEHDLDVVVELTNRLYVLDLGKLIAQGETQSVIEGEELRSAYLGNVRDSSKP
jgi:branched-chain amino acid transport system ATP-binding protein